MKNNPLASILLPNLNIRPFLKKRMGSILNPTYANWKLTITDNYSDASSTDNTAKIIHSFYNLWIYYYEQSNIALATDVSNQYGKVK